MNPHEYIQQCLDTIKKHGFMIQSIMEDEKVYAHSYTVGLSQTLGFELITIGLPVETSGIFLNILAPKLLDTAIEDNVDITDIASVPLRLHTFPFNSQEQGPIISCCGLQPKNLRILLWPDKQNHFPGEPGYSHPCPQSLECVGRTTYFKVPLQKS